MLRIATRLRLFLCVLVIAPSCLMRLAFADDPEPQISLVDYLNEIGEESTFAARKTIFQSHFAGESYTGSADQNIRLVQALVSENDDAAKVVEVAAAKVDKDVKARLAGRAPASNTTHDVDEVFAAPGYVMAEGFGLNAGYSLRVLARVIDSKVDDANFVVAMQPGSVPGTVSFSGSVRIFVGDSKTAAQEFKLQAPWFDVVSPAGSKTIFMYAAQGTKIQLAQDKLVVAEVEVHPVAKSSAGLVSLWAKTVRVALKH